MVDVAWESYLNNNLSKDDMQNDKRDTIEMPECSRLYISTKTIITYLNSAIDLKVIFPKINIIRYYLQKEGVIKKSMKYNFISQSEVDSTLKLLKQSPFYNEVQLKKKIIEPFKDIRKISIGLCNKDIISYRTKTRGAFYNCFVLIIRLKIEPNNYKECHVKIFNTGKVEIPGIKDIKLIEKIKNHIVNLLTDLGMSNIAFENIIETVLINSNFNCGYNINRDRLAELLKKKYNLSTSYDPCSYPGIMCKFYYDKTKDYNNGIEPINKLDYYRISFMIFRTGSILIVGKCTELVLNYIYDFIKKILKTEYSDIFDAVKIIEKRSVKKKVRKKMIIVTG